METFHLNIFLLLFNKTSNLSPNLQPPVNHEKTEANSQEDSVCAAGALCHVVSDSALFYSGTYPPHQPALFIKTIYLFMFMQCSYHCFFLFLSFVKVVGEHLNIIFWKRMLNYAVDVVTLSYFNTCFSSFSSCTERKRIRVTEKEKVLSFSWFWEKSQNPEFKIRILTLSYFLRFKSDFFSFILHCSTDSKTGLIF